MEGASLGLDLPWTVEQLGSSTPIAATTGNAEGVKAAEFKELKKMNKQLTKLVDVNKWDNPMAAIFYFCAIDLGVVYLLIISH
jgi:hypothetical protein